MHNKSVKNTGQKMPYSDARKDAFSLSSRWTSMYMSLSRIFVLFLAAGTLVSVALAADVPSSYVGLRVPPLPSGHEDVGGYLINPHAATEYTVTEVRFNKKRMWWLKKLISRNAKGQAQWEVAAVIAVPQIPQGYYFLMGLCEKHGVAMPEIIAAAKSEDKERLTTIHRVWHINLKTHTFEPYASKGVTCINEGFGV